MRSIALCISLALIPLASGCIDKGTKTECVGFSCVNGWQWPDGGEVRIQYILLPDGSEWTRVTAYFMSHQEPEITQPLPLGKCRKVDPATDLQNENREYIDVGESVTFNLGDTDIVATKQGSSDDGGEQIMDHLGRFHDFYYHGEFTMPRPDEFFNNYTYAETDEQVEFSDIVANAGMFVGPRQSVSKPSGPTIELKAGEDYEFVWDQREPFREGIAHAGSLLWQVPGGLPVMCIPQDNFFTMRPEDVDLLDAPNGLMLLGSVTNEAVLSTEERVINVFGIYCHMYPWMKVN